MTRGIFSCVFSCPTLELTTNLGHLASESSGLLGAKVEGQVLVLFRLVADGLAGLLSHDGVDSGNAAADGRAVKEKEEQEKV